MSSPSNYANKARSIARDLNKRQDILTSILRNNAPLSHFPISHPRVSVESLIPNSGELVITYRDSEKKERESAVKWSREIQGEGVEIVEGRGDKVIGMGEEGMRILGVPENLQMNRYILPSLSSSLPLLLIIAFQFYVLFSPSSPPSSNPTIAEVTRSFIARTTGSWLLPASLIFLVTVHTGEMVYQDRLCVRHATTGWNRVAWDLTTLMLGYGGWSVFKKQVQLEKVRRIQTA